MNTKMLLLLGTVITVFSTPTFAGNALLSPRAKDTQVRTAVAVAATPVSVVYVDSLKSVSPRVEAARVKVIKGIQVSKNPVAECRAKMPGSPRAVTACSQTLAMPACTKLAAK